MLASAPILYIPRIDCEVNLYSAGDLAVGSRGENGYLGNFSIVEPIFAHLNSPVPSVCYLPVSGSVVDKMLNIRSRGRLVCFMIRARARYLLYESKNGYYHLRGADPFDWVLEKTTPTNERTRYVVFSTEEFTEIIKQLKHFDLLRVEVPVRKSDVPPESHIGRVMDLLRSAGEKLTQGDTTGALLDVRNALSNHLTFRPELLLDDPTYLPLIQLNHKPSKAGSEIISGNETMG